ncbi:hypothetical protein [Pantoea allii]|uniref:hypothetical protein n=1 Tax=Pantoea allii TaxID=574096 RepID=UPI003D7A3DA8
MRYLILLCGFSALYTIVTEQMPPEKTNSALYYVLASCALIALAIILNDKYDKSGSFDGVIGTVMTTLIPLAGIALTVYGAGSKLGYFGNSADTGDFINSSSEQLATLSLVTGLVLILISAIRIWMNHMHKN